MAKRCIECGKKQGWIAHNYAGMNFRNFDHPYPHRIEETILPGDPAKDFLCADCANRRKVTCSVHGAVREKFSAGLAPTCSKCVREKKEKGTELPLQYMKMSERAKSGDAKALAWVAACHLLHAERVNIHRSVEHVLGGAQVSSYTTWEASKSKALEFGDWALGVLEFDQKDLAAGNEGPGRAFCRSLLARAQALQSAPGTSKESKGMSSAIGLTAHYEYRPEELAILAGDQTLDDLSQLISELPCCEWLAGTGGITAVRNRGGATRTPPLSAPTVAKVALGHAADTGSVDAASAPRERRTVACPRCRGAIYADSLVDGETTCPRCGQKLRVTRRRSGQT